MCGFSGLLIADHSHTAAATWSQHFTAAAQRIAHRGTDDSRSIRFRDVALHHFRLAFQDVESGRQPMLTGDGRWAITFNGEIYNHLKLRTELERKYSDVQWRTHSDTETILEGWLREGDAFADALEGEFAFVISKTDGSEWFAARDHFGVKPLFLAFPDINTRLFSEAKNIYTLNTKLVAFASEIKALPLKKKWNRDGALRQFVGLFEPICTPFESVIQCPPGGRVHGNRSGSQESPHYQIRVNTRKEPIRGHHKGAFWSLDPADSLRLFRENFAASVEERLLSDVELGVYLSGGIDSKAVAFELAQALSKKSRTWQRSELKSFTVGFETAGYDESEEAVAFARSLNFQPHVLTLSNSALNYSYPHAVSISENLQPYTNGSAKWWLSLFARQSVPGVLTGDGADELLCGYPSFRYCAWWAFSQRNRPRGLNLGQRWRDTVYIKKFMNQSRDPWLAGSSAEGRGDDFTESLALWGVPHPLFGQILAITESILGERAARPWLAEQGPSLRSWFLHGLDESIKNDISFHLNPENALMLWQNYFCHTHLPVQVLNWVGDRMEMANTLEGRTPFLSGRMRRLLFTLPDIALVQGFTDKAVLRKAYATQFPRHFALTPKKQFNAPFVQSSELFRTFDTQGILMRMGIDTANHGFEEALLKESEKTGFDTWNAGERYLHAHRLSALQTLICSAIVERSLVDEHPPQRDHDFESSITRTGGPRS